MAESNHDDLAIEETNYKAPAKVSIAELTSLDQEDESLRRYKEALLGSAIDKIVPPFPSDPRNFIPNFLRIFVDNKLSSQVNLKDGGNNDIIVKIPEASQYFVELEYHVQRDILSGLKYVQALYKGPIRILKDTIMIGSYSPKSEPQIWRSPPETAPSGIISRGSYKIRSLFVDDDKNEYLSFDWKVEIVSK